METPSKTRYAGSISRWDELQALHVAQVQYIHTTVSCLSPGSNWAMASRKFRSLTTSNLVGRLFPVAPLFHDGARGAVTVGVWLQRRYPVSLPFSSFPFRHSLFVIPFPLFFFFRFFFFFYSIRLGTTVTNSGGSYWDEQADQAAAPLYASSIFDAETGFGSNQTDARGCLVDGPFANVTNTLLSNFSRAAAPMCLTRGLDQAQFNLVAQAKVDLCLAAATYVDLNACLGGDPHIAGHLAVGGIMVDVALSPADPLFFMHHTNLDRLWWQWQSQDLGGRLTDMGGANVGSYSILTQAQPKALPESAFVPYFGDGGGSVTTLNHTLWMGGTLPNVTIADVMDLRGHVICAEYL